jgi:antitoxin component of MazEF toxin-antitoxin module
MGNYGLSWTIEVKDQTIVIPKEYIELMELQDGTQYEVKLGRKQIRLHRIFDDEKDED